jgi:hypothetical protein
MLLRAELQGYRKLFHSPEELTIVQGETEKTTEEVKLFQTTSTK